MEYQIGIGPEASKVFANLEKVRGLDVYTPLIDNNLLCGQKQWLRVLREVADVNNEFQNLRTYIAPVHSFMGIFHFLIYPADGPLADQPLCGRILISKDYPIEPPVIHLFNKTNRYNVDVFSNNSLDSRLLHMKSSMCFDILESEVLGGSWRPEFTLSALMSSLLQAIVCINVPQKDGTEKLEFVSMESLQEIHDDIKETFYVHKSIMPNRRTTQKTEAVPVKAKWIWFDEYIISRSDKQYQIVTSEQAIQLQVKDPKKEKFVYTVGFDLSDLKNSPGTVFSIILSNNPSDPFGELKDTVLVRNGVTATAAKKKRGQTIKWFYHGKPLNQENLQLVVTIGYDQFCLSYVDEQDRHVIQGDCPVSFLTEAEIGKVQNEIFYLSVVMKNKGGKQVAVRTFLPKTGFLHSARASPVDKKEHEIRKKLEENQTKWRIGEFQVEYL